jgi:hypothetical protein
MRRLLGAITAHRHAAPPSGAPLCMVGEDQGAAVSLAGSDIGEVLVAHGSRQRLSDWQQQELRRSPAPHRFELEASDADVATLRYTGERFITLKQRVQWSEFTHRLSCERPAHMLAHEASEPFAQGARLFGDLVQFAWRRLRGQRSQRARRNEVGLSEPRDEAVAAVEPINRRVDWRRHRVQEIEAEGVGDEDSGLSVQGHGFSNQENATTV